MAAVPASHNPPHVVTTLANSRRDSRLEMRELERFEELINGASIAFTNSRSGHNSRRVEGASGYEDSRATYRDCEDLRMAVGNPTRGIAPLRAIEGTDGGSV